MGNECPIYNLGSIGRVPKFISVNRRKRRERPVTDESFQFPALEAFSMIRIQMAVAE
jgi:hypothetical protein